MAARGNSVILSVHPQGKRLEGIVVGTPKPGVVMSLSTPFFEGGWHKWVPFAPTSGHRRIIAILLEDELQGKTYDDAYVTLTRCFLYVPVAGEEFNMWIADIAGTGADNTHAAGEQLMVQTATGKLITESSPESEPFTLLEAVTTTTADLMAPVMYTGY